MVGEKWLGVVELKSKTSGRGEGLVLLDKDEYSED